MPYVFNTLKGAAIFVSSVHIYNGLGLLIQFVTFPMVFSANEKIEKEKIAEVQMYEYLPGILYSIFYFALGVIIFKGVESESTGMIKIPAICFAILQIVFVVVRAMFGVFPTPIMMADLSEGENPLHWNIYKNIQYFTMTVLGGVVYCVALFLELQQLQGYNSDVKEMFCISNSKMGKPVPTKCACGHEAHPGSPAMSQMSSPPKKSKSHRRNSSKRHPDGSKKHEMSAQGYCQGQNSGGHIMPTLIDNPLHFYTSGPAGRY